MANINRNMVRKGENVGYQNQFCPFVNDVFYFLVSVLVVKAQDSTVKENLKKIVNPKIVRLKDLGFLFSELWSMGENSY